MFSFSASDWDCVQLTCLIIADANTLQHHFSFDTVPTLWHAIPAFEELQSAWEAKLSSPKFLLYQDAIHKGLTKIGKYYNKFDEKPVYVLALILHLYYKLNYIKMAWGGPEEKKKELEAGNLLAKDWHDEAQKIIEVTMQNYWEEPNPQPAPVSTVSNGPALDDNETLESEFDHHCRRLVQQLMPNSNDCAAELRRYLSDRPLDVMKDTDVIEWWSVHCPFHLCMLQC